MIVGSLDLLLYSAFSSTCLQMSFDYRRWFTKLIYWIRMLRFYGVIVVLLKCFFYQPFVLQAKMNAKVNLFRKCTCSAFVVDTVHRFTVKEKNVL
jgi:hypothetical protein